ncbi:MAG: hypothetical protein KBT40_07680 [bacterium]|nr:hypothetical protein [Candidatus Minthenecus merdequi]
MKKFYFIAIIAIIAVMSSCKKEDDDETPLPADKIDVSLIPGKWNTGTEYWVFEESSLGKTWDEADDVTEEEAQQLRWEVSGNKFIITHIGEMGEEIPKSYYFTKLTYSTFKLKDEFSGKITTYNRVE